MSSVDEFFSILDREDAARAVYKKATNPLASGLSKIKLPGQGQVMATATGVNKAKKSMPKTAKVAHVTNPVDEIAVKSAYDINEDSGFYIVNHEGTQALIGKINEEIFVLKKFDAPVDGELQVRRDKDNVYMVKAPGFKSLVEVNGSKMGVLVEL